MSEVEELRLRLKACEVALIMFLTRDPKVDPKKLARAYFTAYPQPMATESTIDAIVGVAEAAQRVGEGRKPS